MPTFSPESLAKWTGGKWTARPSAPLTGFVTDTRTLRPGQVFVAIVTPKRDGHEFLAAAHAAGAGAALVAVRNPAIPLPQLVAPDPLAAFHAIAREHRRAFQGTVIGITGSAGKTSTKDLLTLLLGGSPGVVATEGNLNNHLGVPLTLTRVNPAAHKLAVIEAGISGPGEMAVLASMIEPDIAIVTLVAPAHLEELGGVEGVAREKAVLPAAVRPGGIAIMPKSCLDFDAFEGLGVPTMVVERSDVVGSSGLRGDSVRFALTQRGDGTSLVLAYGEAPPFEFRMRRVSDGMAQNAALAICAALRTGISREIIQTRLASWSPAALRGELRRDAGRLFYIDCYNSNPASMKDALDVFDAVVPPSEPRLYIIGGMEELGAASAEYHRQVGRGLRLRAEDSLMVIGDHAASVRAGALEGGNAAGQVEIAASLEPIAQRLADFRGAVFMKGSRRWQLERALEPRAQPAIH